MYCAQQHQLHRETLSYDFDPAVMSVASVGVWEPRQGGTLLCLI